MIFVSIVTSSVCVCVDHYRWNSIVAMVFLFVMLFVLLMLVMMMVLLLLVVSMDRHVNYLFHWVWNLFVNREFNLFVDWIVFFNWHFHFVRNRFLNGVRDLFLHTAFRRKINGFFDCSRILAKKYLNMNLLVWLRHGYFYMNWNDGRKKNTENDIIRSSKENSCNNLFSQNIPGYGFSTSTLYGRSTGTFTSYGTFFSMNTVNLTKRKFLFVSYEEWGVKNSPGYFFSTSTLYGFGTYTGYGLSTGTLTSYGTFGRFTEQIRYFILFECVTLALITQLTFLMTSYGFGTGTSTFTGYGICCNWKSTEILLAHPTFNYKIAVYQWGMEWKTDLDHFVRLRNRYFHFVWNLVAEENFIVVCSPWWLTWLATLTFLMTWYGFGTWIFTSYGLSTGTLTWYGTWYLQRKKKQRLTSFSPNFIFSCCATHLFDDSIWFRHVNGHYRPAQKIQLEQTQKETKKNVRTTPTFNVFFNMDCMMFDDFVRLWNRYLHFIRHLIGHHLLFTAFNCCIWSLIAYLLFDGVWNVFVHSIWNGNFLLDGYGFGVFMMFVVFAATIMVIVMWMPSVIAERMQTTFCFDRSIGRLITTFLCVLFIFSCSCRLCCFSCCKRH